MTDRWECERNVWVSPALFSALNDACMEVSRWKGEPLGPEVAGRLRLWPDSGGWSLAERVILAGIVWLDAPVPSGGLGKVWERWDHWLALADERFSLHNSGAVKAAQALGTIEINAEPPAVASRRTRRTPASWSRIEE